MEHLDKILEMSDAEFGAMARNGKFKSREEIDSVYKLMDIVKDIYCIWDMEEGDGYSERMDRDVSYRGRKRDRMGRYSRNDRSYRGSYRGYSNNDDYVERLHELMDEAPDEATRQSIQRMIEKMDA